MPPKTPIKNAVHVASEEIIRPVAQDVKSQVLPPSAEDQSSYARQIIQGEGLSSQTEAENAQKAEITKTPLRVQELSQEAKMLVGKNPTEQQPMVDLNNPAQIDTKGNSFPFQAKPKTDSVAGAKGIMARRLHNEQVATVLHDHPPEQSPEKVYRQRKVQEDEQNRLEEERAQLESMNNPIEAPAGKPKGPSFFGPRNKPKSKMQLPPKTAERRSNRE